ncbi:MAG: universal stress protein [Chloroflexi bacterium]|nr:universal stress protein [Chloroflexota bacterium]
MFHSILVPLDGSELAERALPYATQLADSNGQLVLTRAVTAQNTLFGDEMVAENDRIREAEAYLRGIAAGLPVGGFTVLQDVYYGHAPEAICDEANMRNVRAIVMSTHGRTGLRRIVYGSVAEQVLHEAQLPVFLVPARCSRVWKLLNPHVVLPLDTSDVAESAIEPAVGLAKQLGASILLLSSVEPAFNTGYPDPALSALPEAFQAAEAETGDYLDNAARRITARGVRVQTKMRIGNPATAILEAAADERTAAVVMATHGRTGLWRAVLGSVAEDVVRHAETPVMVVPAFAYERAKQPGAWSALASTLA